MVTLLVYLVVVGGAVVTIVKLTLGDGTKPATGGLATHRDRLARYGRDRVVPAARSELRRLSAFLVSSQDGDDAAPAAPQAQQPRRATTSSWPPRPLPPPPAKPLSAPMLAPEPPRSPRSPAPERTGDGSEPPATSSGSAPPPPDDTAHRTAGSAALAPARPHPVRAVMGLKRPRAAPSPATSTSTWSARTDLLRVVPAAPSSTPLQRSARLLRGTVTLLLLLALLGTVLAAVLAGTAAAVAVGVRAAIG